MKHQQQCSGRLRVKSMTRMLIMIQPFSYGSQKVYLAPGYILKMYSYCYSEFKIVSGRNIVYKKIYYSIPYGLSIYSENCQYIFCGQCIRKQTRHAGG
jgi:hypothetical protein